MPLTHFQKKVYSLTKKIPKGKITTYAEIAKALGIRSAQAVGTALKRNPFAPGVPCHRVVRSDGRIGGYAGKMDNPKKAQLLREEGVGIKDGNVEDFEKNLKRLC